MNWQTEKKADGTQVTFSRYNDCTEYRGSKNPDGTFSVVTHDEVFENVPYKGDFDNYREADAFADRQPWSIFPFVVHVNHNSEDAYVLFTVDKSVYIRV